MGGPLAVPRVGVGVVIVREDKVLLGLRKGSHGAGQWSCAGGHLEAGETIEACARREAAEETGLKLGTVDPAPYTNDLFADEGLHYVTLFVVATAEGEPRVMEPDKCSGWSWHDWDHLPEPLFPPLKSLYTSGFRPEV